MSLFILAGYLFGFLFDEIEGYLSKAEAIIMLPSIFIHSPLVRR